MNEPIFKSIFGKTWSRLPPVMHKHYANRPYSDDIITVTGTLDVMCAGPLKWIAPLMKLMRQIPCVNENSVPVTVKFKSSLNDKGFQFQRIFNFSETKPYIFQSQMMQVKDNEVIEIMRFGLCWRLLYFWDDNKVKLKHRGYAFRILGKLVPLPLTMLLGEGYAEEIAIDDETFTMITHITHPWWGKVYEYKGRFRVVEDG